jgi:hypothetical protein
MTFQYCCIPCIPCPDKKQKPEVGSRCFNLVENPSFEAGLAGWITSGNVVAGDDIPFEGTQVAIMSAGVASMYQDVPLSGADNKPLFFSFNIVSTDQPKLTVEILWLDANHNAIATGLRMFVNQGTTDNVNNSRITFFDITDTPPAGVSFARLLFSKAIGEEGSSVSIDQIILTPVNSINLVKNPSFEVGLTSWTSTDFFPDFEAPFQGAADAVTSTGGMIFQDVFIGDQPSKSSYLFSFGATALGDEAALTIRVLWLNAANDVIGPPGLEITILSLTLPHQENYLTYLDLTKPAPSGAVKARIIFETVIDESALNIDQIILARAGSSNLLQNPSFEEGESNWTFVNAGIFAQEATYEGRLAAVVNFEGVIFQDVPITNAEGHCFIFNCGLRVERFSGGVGSTDTLIKVFWLDKNGREIGLGLCLFAFGEANPAVVFPQWLVYTGITDPAPAGTVAARVQFTQLRAVNAFTNIDKVVFGRLV